MTTPDAAPGHAPDDRALLDEQIAYYRARAPEYDEWWQRQGRWDRGVEHTARWQREVDHAAHALARLDLTGQVLEIAAGTGWWSEHLLRTADELTLLDVAPEALAINRDRLARSGSATPVRTIAADVFDWKPTSQYDAVFFSYWLCHVPHSRFESFWALVEQVLKPNGRAVWLADAGGPASSTSDRTLNDGRAYRVVKLFYEPSDLVARLAALGWRAEVTTTDSLFQLGVARRRSRQP